MNLRCASFNVLADAWLSCGEYEHVASDLLEAGARIPHLLRLIANLHADVIGLQEVELPLVTALEATGAWQLFWSQNKGGDPDGCLILVRRGITVTYFATHTYSAGSGHIVQWVTIEDTTFANTHIEYDRPDTPRHRGIAQTRELLMWLSAKQRTVIFTDCNDRPNGPVRALMKAAGFTNTCDNEPTALIDQERAALDLIAVRGVRATQIRTDFWPENIPSVSCPSDHVPVMAWVEVG